MRPQRVDRTGRCALYFPFPSPGRDCCADPVRLCRERNRLGNTESSTVDELQQRSVSKMEPSALVGLLHNSCCFGNVEKAWCLLGTLGALESSCRAGLDVPLSQHPPIEAAHGGDLPGHRCCRSNTPARLPTQPLARAKPLSSRRPAWASSLSRVCRKSSKLERLLWYARWCVASIRSPLRWSIQRAKCDCMEIRYTLDVSSARTVNGLRPGIERLRGCCPGGIPRGVGRTFVGQ